MGFADGKEIHVNAGNYGLVHQVGPVNPDEMGLQDGFPAGDGGDVPEAPAFGRVNDGGVIVGFHVQNLLDREGYRLPARGERDGSRRSRTFLVQPGFEEIAARRQDGQDQRDEERIRQDERDGARRRVIPEKPDVAVGKEEQHDLRDQDAQDDAGGILDPRPFVLEMDLREKIPGCQGAGQEHGADEQGFRETVSQAGDDDRHHEDGQHPVRYDQQSFHCSCKCNKKLFRCPSKRGNWGFNRPARGFGLRAVVLSFTFAAESLTPNPFAL